MTELSPAAQAAVNAYFNADGFGYQNGLAAAIEALADQVVPANGSRKNNEIRSEILAIATELKSAK